MLYLGGYTVELPHIVQAIALCLLPNIGGWINAYICKNEFKSRDGQPTWYDRLIKPSFTPPPWVFGPAWTILYTSTGYASYLVCRDDDWLYGGDVNIPLILYVTQLLLNWLWTPLFFLSHKLQLAFIELTVLVVITLACGVAFLQVNTIAGYIFIPYTMWLTYADILNFSFWKLNPDPYQAKLMNLEKS